MPSALIDMELAETEVAREIAGIEGQLQSSLVPDQQKMMLKMARCQLFGSIAMIRIHNLISKNADEETAVLQ